MVNHPSHYNQGKYEAIEDWELNFNLGNAIKSKSVARGLIGDGWTVDVIAWILSFAN